jgi:precorrin-8X/cobalt-precorrin-8 methylmutase
VSLGYLRDPETIYAQSFSAIRAEADLSGIPPALEAVVVRIIHACGMTDIVPDLRWGGDVVGAVEAALRTKAPVFCDCEAVRAGISRRSLPPSIELAATLNDPAVPELAQGLGTTRSAAAVELWRERLAGAVVVIGNAPTALHHLLDLLEAGAGRPAAIIATPVGFVGAAESKARLALDCHEVPFLTLLGRRGGSAMASAALNAIAGNMAW